MRNVVVIVGAGQLGSRHLQGVLKVNTPLSIFVVDPSADSLEIARQRAGEINHSHQVNYLTGWSDVPFTLDIVIVATNSNVREKIVIYLAENYKIKYLILEKVLFPALDAYQNVEILLEKSGIKTWVNHPRRMFQSYQMLKTEMSEAPKIFQVTGGNWGLGCNGLHFIDLFAFLASSEIKTIDTSKVDREVLRSKREGFIEFTGTISGTLTNGSTFTVTSITGEPSATTITIFDADSRFVIQESGTPAIFTMRKVNNFRCEEAKFQMEYQSSLTTSLVNSLVENGTSLLPTYKDACRSHFPFIDSLLTNYRDATNSTDKILPIT